MENNSDHWNALLISLRELAEWVIAEEAVLEAMGPIAGDEISIRRQQEAARSFSRQLEDKRAVIENNLQTGRQHLDSANIQAEEGKNIFKLTVRLSDEPRISYRNGWNTEALIFENLKPVEITKKLFQHHLNILENV